MERNKLYILSLQHWSCQVFGELIVYLHFLFVLHIQCSNHQGVELLEVFNVSMVFLFVMYNKDWFRTLDQVDE